MGVFFCTSITICTCGESGGVCKNVCKIVKWLKIFSFVTLWLTTLDISEVVEAQKEITQRCKSNRVVHSDLTNEAICAIQTC